MGQTNVMTQYLGRLAGLATANEIQECYAMQLLEDGTDLFNDIMGGKPDDRINKWIAYLTGRMHESSGFFFESLSYVDFGMYVIIDTIVAKKAVGKLEGVDLGPKP